MAKVKISKKSTRIDMTAMCDVAFLLLSFFIMTATAKQPEPLPVDTPESTVQTKLPDENLATINIGGKKVFFTILGTEIRKKTLEKIGAKYNVTFTAKEIEEFSNLQGFGVPLNQLKGLLALENGERLKEGLQPGIPYDSLNNQLNDWVFAAREAAKDIEFKDLDIAIKGDAKEDYMTVKRVIDILQDQKKNKFFLVTGLRNQEF
ncbi:MAG: biopolymer transporter ExbD [Flavobacterium sp.]|nr:MAG: biopolymer transporter ExbD [Flavobacterium sp.]